MKKTLRNRLSLLLIGLLLLCMLPARAIEVGDEAVQFSVQPESIQTPTAEDELLVLPFWSAMGDRNVLYSWTASNVDVDCEEFTSNLVSSSEADVRWNETGIMYTGQGMQEVVLHSFLNETVSPGSGNYGLPQMENLVVDNKSFTVSTQDMEAIDLSFLYAYKSDGTSVNAATSGLLRVYVSEDGTSWSEDYVGVRSARILGCGTSRTGETVIYYQIHCENLMDIDGLTTGDSIYGVRIMPDGETGTAAGTFALCELAVTGYEHEEAFKAAVPARIGFQRVVIMDEDAVRKGLVNAAACSDADSSLGKITDAMAMLGESVPENERDFLNILQSNLVDGIDIKAKDSVIQLIAQLRERESPLTEEKANQILAEYETIETTEQIVKTLNTPQQIFRAYAKAKPGDLLLRVTPTEAAVYMITGCEPVILLDGVNVDFPNSTMSYLTADGEQTLNFTDMYGKYDFVPLTVVSGPKTVSWQMDVHANMADGVKVAVVSNLEIETCRIAVGDESVTLNNLNTTADVYTDKRLDDAVAALADGKHRMTVDLTNDIGNTERFIVELEVKDGKAAVLGTTAHGHSTDWKTVLASGGTISESGKYYLTEATGDITVNADVEVTLCLNGQTATRVINQGSVLKLCNCSIIGGKISNGSDQNSLHIAGGTTTIYDNVTIEGPNRTSGSCVQINAGNLIMEGGKIAGSVHVNSGSMTVKNGAVDGNLTGTGYAISGGKFSQKPAVDFLATDAGMLSIMNNTDSDAATYQYKVGKGLNNVGEYIGHESAMIMGLYLNADRNFSTDGVNAYTVELAGANENAKGDIKVDSVTGNLLVTATGIAAKEMHDEIAFTVKEGDAVLFSDTISIYEAAKAWAANSTNEEEKTMLADMIAYGNAARKEFAYNYAEGDVLPTLDGASSAVAEEWTGTDGAGVSNGQQNKVAVTLSLKDRIELNVYLNDKMAVISNVKFDGADYAAANYKVDTTSGKYTRVSFFNIPVVDVKKAVEFTVTLSDDTAFTVKYSIADYAVQAKNGAQGALIQELMEYVDSVSDYLASD